MPDQHFGRHVGTEVTDTWSHVTVRQLEPGAGEGVGELVRIFQKTARDFLVGRVCTHRDVAGQHHGRQTLGRIVRVRNGAGTGATLGGPLVRTGRALRQFPFETEQVLEVVVAPLRRCGGPGHFQATGDRVATLAGLETALPAEALGLDTGRLGFVRHVVCRACTVRLAEGVTTGIQCHGLFVVHRHAGEGLANVVRGTHGIGLAVRTFGVDINQAHLHGCERVLEVT